MLRPPSPEDIGTGPPSLMTAPPPPLERNDVRYYRTTSRKVTTTGGGHMDSQQHRFFEPLPYQHPSMVVGQNHYHQSQGNHYMNRNNNNHIPDAHRLRRAEDAERFQRYRRLLAEQQLSHVKHDNDVHDVPENYHDTTSAATTTSAMQQLQPPTQSPTTTTAASASRRDIEEAVVMPDEQSQQRHHRLVASAVVQHLFANNHSSSLHHDVDGGDDHDNKQHASHVMDGSSNSSNRHQHQQQPPASSESLPSTKPSSSSPLDDEAAYWKSKYDAMHQKATVLGRKLVAALGNQHKEDLAAMQRLQNKERTTLSHVQHVLRDIEGVLREALPSDFLAPSSSRGASSHGAKELLSAILVDAQRVHIIAQSVSAQRKLDVACLAKQSTVLTADLAPVRQQISDATRILFLTLQDAALPSTSRPPPPQSTSSSVGHGRDHFNNEAESPSVARALHASDMSHNSDGRGSASSSVARSSRKHPTLEELQYLTLEGSPEMHDPPQRRPQPHGTTSNNTTITSSSPHHRRSVSPSIVPLASVRGGSLLRELDGSPHDDGPFARLRERLHRSSAAGGANKAVRSASPNNSNQPNSKRDASPNNSEKRRSASNQPSAAAAAARTRTKSSSVASSSATTQFNVHYLLPSSSSHRHRSASQGEGLPSTRPTSVVRNNESAAEVHRQSHGGDKAAASSSSVFTGLRAACDLLRQAYHDVNHVMHRLDVDGGMVDTALTALQADLRRLASTSLQHLHQRQESRDEDDVAGDSTAVPQYEHQQRKVQDQQNKQGQHPRATAGGMVLSRSNSAASSIDLHASCDSDHRQESSRHHHHLPSSSVANVASRCTSANTSLAALEIEEFSSSSEDESIMESIKSRYPNPYGSTATNNSSVASIPPPLECGRKMSNVGGGDVEESRDVVVHPPQPQPSWLHRPVPVLHHRNQMKEQRASTVDDGSGTLPPRHKLFYPASSVVPIVASSMEEDSDDRRGHQTHTTATTTRLPPPRVVMSPPLDD